MRDYGKPPLTFIQQLQKLKTKGLHVNDDVEALRQLASVSYYRLSGYWYPFRHKDRHGNLTGSLIPGTTIKKVLDLYEFDRRLRILVMDAIERVEVAVRTQLTYHIGHAYGPFGHTSAANFHSGFDHASWLMKLETETSRSSDAFITHYRNQYRGFPRIPIWMSTEVMTLGSLSVLYRGLKKNQATGLHDRKPIADYFRLHHKRLSDWLHVLTYVRNLCAHHGRLWNRELAIRPDNAKDPQWLPPITPRNDRVFYILLMLRHLQRCSGNGNDWAISVSNLLQEVDAIPFYRLSMGIPNHWREHPVWR